MRRPRQHLPYIAFAASLLIHAMLMIALPMVIEAAAVKDQPDADADHVDEPMVMVLPEEEAVEVELGIDAATPPSPAWIGHVEPQPQLAEQFETEQGAFTDEPVAAAPPPPAEPVEHQEVQELAATETAPVAEASPAHEEQLTKEAAQAETLPGEIPLGQNADANADPHLEPVDSREFEKITEKVKEFLEELQKAIDETVRKSSEPVEAPPQEATPPLPSEQSPTEVRPQIAPDAQEALTEVGTPADMESSPTSIIDVPPDQWQLGKPLARHGLQLKPRRPTFTLLTLMTASPGNPLCVIKFGGDGVPVDASLLRSSGDKRIDDAVLASLYRWRAEGAELKQLAEGKTLDVQMRIILNRRAAAAEQQAHAGGKSSN